MKQQLLKRLLKRRRIINDTCWIFVGPDNKQKREIYVQYKNFLVHRVSAFIHLDFDLHSHNLICHNCRTPYCWNPEHIYIGNTSTNTRDSIRDGTFKNPNTDKLVCKHGHALVGSNLYIWIDRKTQQVHRWCRICRTNADKKHKNK